MAAEQPRFRLFAGPNGSGKSTLFLDLKKQGVIHTGIYIAADRIESEFKRTREWNFNAYRVKVSQEEFRVACLKSGLTKKFDPDILSSLTLSSGILKLSAKHTQPEYASYIAALIADYLVDKIFQSGQSFCFESVMSHASKIAKFKMADELGYASYLYFTTISDPDINIQRVADRVRKGGHHVPDDKVLERYKGSMGNLIPAAAQADKTYIFDNTTVSMLVCSIDRIAGKLEVSDNYPTWLTRYFDPSDTTIWS